jgi:sortase (surface protein transpeptidase)
MMRRPRPALMVLIGSLVLLIGAPLAWAGFVVSQPGEQIASVGERPSADEAQATQATVRSTAPQVAGSDVPRIGTPVENSEQPAPVIPTGISIAKLGVQAPVDQVGVYDDGSVEIPEDIARVGWYRFGAGPGQGAGSTVIVGHRDGFDEGPGAFYSVSSLEPGDIVELQLEDGSTQEYEVVSREAIDRELLPSDDVFNEDGPERLTLISCIGYFDRDNGGYQQNVVVTAVPAAIPAGNSMSNPGIEQVGS